MNIAEEIKKLDELKQSGALSEEEFQEAKESLLAKHKSTGEQLKRAVDGIASDENTWGMFIHLSQFCGYIIPLAGLVLPIVLWQIKKDESKVLDQHGRNVVNWMITEFIMGVIFGLLCFVLIGVPLLAILGVLAVVFPIIGGVKANNGEVWRYPLSIEFFKPDEDTNG